MMAEISEYQAPTLSREDEKADAPSSPTQSELNEKSEYINEKRPEPDEEEYIMEEEDVTYVNGEPVITTGKDVSRFVVDVRDDGDPALTFRSFVLGTLCSGLGATLIQVSPFSGESEC
jgi:hypothetical protein